MAMPGGTVRIHGKCLQASAGLAVLESCQSGSAAQQWQISPDGPGTMLANPGSDPGCLTYQGDGAQARLAACPAATDPFDPATAWRFR
jgi:hypothetical protein